MGSSICWAITAFATSTGSPYCRMPRFTNLPEQPCTWTAPVEHYLASHGIECDRAVPLDGGLSAYVWRLEGVVLQSDKTAKCHSKKCTEPYVLKFGDTTIKAAPEIPTPPGRMLIEARALQSSAVAVACRREPSVQVPSLLFTTDEAIIMSWGGDSNLQRAYREHRGRGMADSGRRLGSWLGALHLAGLDSQEEIADWRNEWSGSIAQKECEYMRTTLLDMGTAQDTVARAVGFFQDEPVVRTLTPWDFRPMNTLLRASEDMSQSSVMTIVDWECSTCGDPAFDIRLWAAETLFLESKFGTSAERPVLSAFLKAYRAMVGHKIVDGTFLRRVAVFLGSILIYTLPFDPWDCTEQADVEWWRALGISFIKAGAADDIDWLKKSALGPLVVA